MSDKAKPIKAWTVRYVDADELSRQWLQTKENAQGWADAFPIECHVVPITITEGHADAPPGLRERMLLNALKDNLTLCILDCDTQSTPGAKAAYEDARAKVVQLIGVLPATANAGPGGES